MPRKPLLQVNPAVFFTSASAILLFVIIGALFPLSTERVFGHVQAFIVEDLGWFYIVSATAFLVFVFWLLISPYGDVKLGKDEDEPEFGNLTWFAMLFSAGMGIGLLFFSVAEPVMHFTDPPRGTGGTVEAARQAMNITFFHWGLHAWAIYIIVGLALAYFAYRHDLPLTLRSTLYPLLGRRIYGRMGDSVEILGVFGTVFGVATSLGVGVTQINAGLEYLGILNVSTTSQLILITVITLLATASVVTGLDVGIRRLSELNLGLSLLLLVFVFLAGPTVFLLNSFVQSIGQYVTTLVAATFRTDAYVGAEWQASWTMFYWGWWISWSPFVGMFIARISRGRTIRSFVTGVLLVPTLLTFIWMTVFGNTAIFGELMGESRVAEAVAQSMPTALFVMLGELPLGTITSGLAVLVIATYFVTSSDSASLVVDILTSGGNTNPPVWQRVFWAITEGAVAATLLLAGGLAALRTAAITTALPFCVVMLLMCYSLVAGLRAERRASSGTFVLDNLADPGSDDGDSTEPDWRDRLRQIVGRHDAAPDAEPDSLVQSRDQMTQYIEHTVVPAFRKIRRELERLGREVAVEKHRFHVTLTVVSKGREEFRYGVRSRAFRSVEAVFPELDRRDRPRTLRAEVILRGSAIHEYPMESFDHDQIIESFLHEYAKWMGW